LIAASDLGTVAEILDFEGVWTTDLIETMLPVAVEIETNRLEAMNRAVLSALASILSKDGSKDFESAMKDARAGIVRSYRMNRGLEPTPGESPADQLLNVARQLGIQVTKGKPKKGKRK
jgi:hypothetical protein